MTCISCQERREAIARIAARVGIIVFGGKRVLAAPSARRDGVSGGAGSEKADDDRGESPGVHQGPSLLRVK
jgi:hypothetical protein